MSTAILRQTENQGHQAVRGKNINLVIQGALTTFKNLANLTWKILMIT